MNLKLKRLVRTQSSEQYALFDLDQLDSQQQPMTIGKLDMHYTGEGVYGTILFWDDVMRELSSSRRESLIQSLLEEIAQPMGVPNEFVVEFFAPTLDEYHVFHNLDRGIETDGETGSNGEDEDGVEEGDENSLSGGSSIHDHADTGHNNSGCNNSRHHQHVSNVAQTH